jgi:hypothetical protein
VVDRPGQSGVTAINKSAAPQVAVLVIMAQTSITILA